MSLLSDIAETSLDPGYARAHQDGPPPRARTLVTTTLLVAGLLVGIAVLTDARQAPQAAGERKALIGQVKTNEAENQRLREQLAAVRSEVDALRARAIGPDPSASAGATQLGATSGSTRVTGPGVVVTVDDSTTLTGTDAQVLDQDLRQLVNGLWAARAEAISINGHRLTSRTAIRGAGAAITVDYSSLTRPYRVEAIGDPRALVAQFQATTGGQWWAYLKQNYGMRYDIASVDSLTLEPDPGLRVEKAGPRR